MIIHDNNDGAGVSFRISIVFTKFRLWDAVTAYLFRHQKLELLNMGVEFFFPGAGLGLHARMSLEPKH
jgi:hypothetical protein